MLLQVQKQQEIIEGNYTVLISSFSEPREKKIKEYTRSVVDCILTPSGISKGYNKITTELVIPDKEHFDGSKFHELIEAADPDFDIDAFEEYDTDNLLKKKLIVKIKKGRGTKREFANIVGFYPSDTKMSIVAFETSDKPSVKKSKKK